MGRDLQAELKRLHESNPNAGVVFNGKTAMEWYKLYTQEAWLVSRRHAPFDPGAEVIAKCDSPQRYVNGDVNKNCHCLEGMRYTIEGCVWGWNVGWLVSIRDEFHIAADFKAAAVQSETNEKGSE